MTTREAARLLGVSIGTVQKWVETGALAAWKTPGGHRRLRRGAVLGLLSSHATPAGSAADAAEFVAASAPDYPVGPDESERLAALRRSGLFGSGPDAVFDRIVRVAAQLTDAPLALLTLLGSRRQWFKSRLGTELAETPRAWAFCNHTILAPRLLVVHDAAGDPRFAANPLVTGPTQLRFYAGMALRDPDGFALGALCVLDSRPRQLSSGQRQAFGELAALAADRLRGMLQPR
ncbi:GAF domain-containing protein [Aerosticca soli]|uniref:Sensor histidine kinase n=1 Tax=Aerosticca soli TaxID=2010829 RepID=A0A2Z6E3M6_9GAMM|nr:GAF domain-containing protein [Aerosticca soli]BBD79361.1 sensor histidine kinase [Aerosticca soli]